MALTICINYDKTSCYDKRNKIALVMSILWVTIL
jgi:hypothetical protein